MIKTHTIDSSLQQYKSKKKSFLDLRLTLILTSAITLLSILYLTGLLAGVDILETETTLNSTILSIISLTTINACLYSLGRFPGNRPLSYALPVITFINLLLFSLITLFRIEYSVLILLTASLFIPLISLAELRFRQARVDNLYAVIPEGFYQDLITCNPQKFIVIDSNDFKYQSESEFGGYIVDSTEKLSPEWQQFIAHKLSEDAVVIDSVTAYESITGKSPLNHYGEIANHDIGPNRLLLSSKRLVESLLIALSVPLWVPLIMIVAIAVKVESKGPAFFTQKRIGQGGKEFTMYKIRSMCIDSECSGARFAGENDPRITKIGKFIRKMRIDELPQFLNVLKGDMALIGPRPEQATFAEEFEKKIPLYSYRHIVKPGITGWAQVTHGYAADEDETREKLAHDFYYVKNFSLWLDLDIIFKTIKTMLTGFGAR
jgi:exopolysaccharide biosynthesis polyprenyl glycosylphosphotransferase